MPREKLPRPSQEFVDYVNRLAAERKAEHSLTWSTIADKMGVDKSLLTLFRKRERGLRPDLLQKLAEQLSPNPDDKENTRVFVSMFMRKAGQPMLPGFLELLKKIVEAPPEDFMKIMETTSEEERSFLREQLMFFRLRAEYQAGRPNRPG
jgi:transcriptional regulator with XRE-family HTH domain